MLGSDWFRGVPGDRTERSMLKGRETGLVKPTPEAARMHARRPAHYPDHVTLVNESKVGRESREVRLASRKAIEGGRSANSISMRRERGACHPGEDPTDMKLRVTEVLR